MPQACLKGRKMKKAKDEQSESGFWFCHLPHQGHRPVGGNPNFKPILKNT